MESLKFAVNAKINLSLAVMGKRPDGYHDLDTVMQTVDISDGIFIKKSPVFKFECNKFGGEENIACKAARRFFEAAHTAPAAEIKIEKSIPSSAGLGGGSADAAGVLVGLNALFNTGLSSAELCKIAVTLGADVPFLIDGGTQRAGGIGEILTPLPHMPDCTFLIVLTGEKPSTGEMFARLDRVNYPKPDIEKTVRAISGGSYADLTQALGNSFSVLWNGEKITEKLYKYGADTVALSGSGPARFAVFADREKADKAKALLENDGVTAYICRPASSSVVFK